MKKLLVFQHIEREAPSYIAEYAKDTNIELDVVEFWKPFRIPDVSPYDGLIILGGPMGVYEDFPWKKAEIKAIEDALQVIPVLGVCLGAQLLAHVLGAKVYPHHTKEVGYDTVSLTPEGERSSLFRGLPQEVPVLQWHGDTFDLPDGASLLATSSVCTNQAFSKDNAYGIQFHCEISRPLLATIAKEDKEWANKNHSLDEKKLFSDAKKLEPVMRKQCYHLLDNFLG